MVHRNHGGVLFLDVRDSSGVLQAVSAPEGASEKAHAVAERLRLEFVVRLAGSCACGRTPTRACRRARLTCKQSVGCAHQLAANTSLMITASRSHSGGEMKDF